MKKTMLLPVLLLVTILTNAQKSNFTDFIHQHKTEPGFTYALLSKDLFEATIKADIKNEDWKKAKQVIGEIGMLSILAADSINNTVALYSEAQQLLTDDFEDILTVRDGKDRVSISSKSEENTITDLVLLVGSESEFVLICFTGELNLSNITDLLALADADQATSLANKSSELSASFSISPNPGNGRFMLSFNDESDAPAVISAMDQNGKVVATLKLTKNNSQSIGLESLPAGYYWLQLRTEKGRVGVKQVQIVK